MTHAHKKGEIVSAEFVRYRWWVDADVGLVFWHDHAFGATTWPHGGIGSTIVEPWGSVYRDPKTGKGSTQWPGCRCSWYRAYRIRPATVVSAKSWFNCMIRFRILRSW